MKALFRLVGAVIVLAGLCSCESDIPSREPGIGDKFQRGIRGQGSLYIPEQEQSPISTPAR